MTQLKGAMDSSSLYTQTWHVPVPAKSGTHSEDIQQQAGETGKDLSGHGQVRNPSRPNKARARRSLENTYESGCGTRLKHHQSRYPVPDWVHQQVYLHPYPKELMLRYHV